MKSMLLVVLGAAIAVGAITLVRREHTPVGAPAVQAPTPADVSKAQTEAVRKFPALGQKDSMMNRRFLELVAEERAGNPHFTADPNWPMRLAEQAAWDITPQEYGRLGETPAEAERRFGKPLNRKDDDDTTMMIYESKNLVVTYVFWRGRSAAASLMRRDQTTLTPEDMEPMLASYSDGGEWFRGDKPMHFDQQDRTAEARGQLMHFFLKQFTAHKRARADEKWAEDNLPPPVSRLQRVGGG